jgi:hypothetical protein
MDAIPVAQAGTRVRHVAVPHAVREAGNAMPLQLAPAARIEQTEFDAFGVVGKEREVDALAVPRRAERSGPAFLDHGAANADHSVSSADALAGVAS